MTSDQLLEACDHLLLSGPLAVVIAAAAVDAAGRRRRIIEEILEEMVDFWNNHWQNVGWSEVHQQL